MSPYADDANPSGSGNTTEPIGTEDPAERVAHAGMYSFIWLFRPVYMLQ